MKRKIKIIFISVVILMILFVPLKSYIKDGGSVEYCALTYSIIKRHSIRGENTYNVGTVVYVFGVEVYNDTQLIHNHKEEHSKFCVPNGYSY